VEYAAGYGAGVLLLGSALVRAATGFDQGLVKFETEHFLPIYRALNKVNAAFVIIGGQACALWALRYQDRSPKLKHFFPYATRDLDFCATSRKDVTATAEALEVEPRFPRKHDASQEIGLLKYELSNGAVIVQFLRGSYQLSAEEIIRRKREFHWDKHGLVLWVMHPIHCLEDKLGLVCRMDQSERQDLRHLKMALYFVPLFITDALLDGGTDAVLDMCQHILKLAKSSRLGLQCYRKHGVRIERAIPGHVLAENATGKLEKFVMKQLPRELMTLEKLREKISRAS
jgi:hypothetical protein